MNVDGEHLGTQCNIVGTDSFVNLMVLLSTVISSIPCRANFRQAVGTASICQFVSISECVSLTTPFVISLCFFRMFLDLGGGVFMKRT